MHALEQQVGGLLQLLRSKRPDLPWENLLANLKPSLLSAPAPGVAAGLSPPARDEAEDEAEFEMLQSLQNMLFKLVGDVATLAKRQQQQDELLRLQGGLPAQEGLLANEQIEFSEDGAAAAAGDQDQPAPLEEMDDAGNEA
jgi:hypothetical protein